MRSLKNLPIFYGWLVVAACFIVTASYGVFYSFGVFFKPLQAEFGWSRALTSSITSVHLITFAISTIVMGRLTDKYGPRFSVILGAILIGVGLSLCSQVKTPGQFYLFYIIASLGAGVIWSPTTATAQRWFIKQRGLALGIVSAGVGIGMLVYSTLSNYLIYAYGWQMTYILVGSGTALVLILVSLLLVRTPEDIGLTPYGSTTPDIPVELDTQAARGESWTTREAFRTKTAWGLAMLYFFTVLPIQMVAVHLVPFAIDIGIDKTAAASAFGLVGVFSIIGRLTMSTTADRIGWKRALAICCAACTCILLWLIPTRNLWMLYVFIVLYGFFYGGKVPLIPGLIYSFFGTKSLSEITGIMHAASLVVSAGGPILGGWIFDYTGSYSIAFLVCAVSWALAAFLAIKLKAPTKNVIAR